MMYWFLAITAMVGSLLWAGWWTESSITAYMASPPMIWSGVKFIAPYWLAGAVLGLALFGAEIASSARGKAQVQVDERERNRIWREGQDAGRKEIQQKLDGKTQRLNEREQAVAEREQAVAEEIQRRVADEVEQAKRESQQARQEATEARQEAQQAQHDRDQAVKWAQQQVADAQQQMEQAKAEAKEAHAKKKAARAAAKRCKKRMNEPAVAEG